MTKKMNKVLFSMLVLLLSVLTRVQASTEVWSGEFKADNWNSVLDVSGSSFSSLKVGDQVVFSGAVNGGAQIQIANNDFTAYVTENKYNCVGFTGKYSACVDEFNIDIFKGGICIKGENFILKTISNVKILVVVLFFILFIFSSLKYNKFFQFFSILLYTST